MEVVFLKMKVMSLAAEGRIIRRERRQWKQERRYQNHPRRQEVNHSLHLHCDDDVGGEARSALLAYGFLRGRPYATMEPKRHTDPRWARVAQLACRYGFHAISHDREVVISKLADWVGLQDIEKDRFVEMMKSFVMPKPQGRSFSPALVLTPAESKKDVLPRFWGRLYYYLAWPFAKA